jgi:hypothetical protein
MTAIATTFTFAQQLLLNIAGPLLTAIVGTLLIGLVVGRITRKAQERREDQLLRGALGREERALRQSLIEEMTDTASALYIQTQLYWRVSTDRDPTRNAGDLPDLRKELDAQYVKSFTAGLELESRLDSYFVSDEVWRRWHRTMDFLTVRYFQVLVPDKGEARAERLKGLYKTNSKPSCTDTDVASLNTAKTVLTGYRKALSEASLLVLTMPLRDTGALTATYKESGKRAEELAADHAPEAELGPHASESPEHQQSAR